MSSTLRVGTRRSALARAQARSVADALAAQQDRSVELVGVETYGDTSTAALSQIGGTGVFVSALRESLLAGDIDVAVHSLKDLPTQAASGLTIAAVPAREDPYDVVVARNGLTLEDLPPGARIGTGSLRRAAQLRARYPKLEMISIRGNVDTRIGKVAAGECDGVVLAGAGLARLGRLGEATEVLDPARMTPAPAQGALAVECREDSGDLVAALGGLDDPPSRAAVTAERGVLATLEAGCSAPVGAYGEVVAPGDHDAPHEDLHLRAVVADIAGEAAIRLSSRGSSVHAESLGRQLATDMLAQGAAALMGEGDR